jgi:acyloxyacyl hydrolase
MDLIDRLTKSHEPVVDIDRDLFSSASLLFFFVVELFRLLTSTTSAMPALRGSNWRGADCNDLDKNVHPGRKTNPYPGSGVDYNCNGVRGVNNQGKEWKGMVSNI